jgi:hypothetical protein
VPEPRLVVVAIDRVRGWLDRFEANHGCVRTSWHDGALLACADDGSWARLRPVLPGLVVDSELSRRAAEADVDLLLSRLAPARCCVVAVRRGGFACAVVDGSGVVASKVSRRHVQGRTAAGGWSQQRFARRRDKQVHELVEAVVAEVARIVTPHLPLDAVVTAGDAALVEEVLADRRLSGLRDVCRGAHLSAGDPEAAWVRGLPRLLTSAQVTVLDITR